MEPNIFRYVWKHTRMQQIWVLAIVLLSMPTYFFALDLPKQIVNGPIQGQGYEQATATQPFLQLSLPVPESIAPGGSLEIFGGFQLDRFNMLFALSLSFLALVCINGLFKFYINTYKGRLGERMLRRLRFELVDSVLRFPMNQFRRVKPSEVATMVKDEVEPLGGFIGDAFVQPVFLGGQAITAMAFILLQSFWLGLIAGGIVAAQAILIPKLRRRLIELGRQRQLTARDLAGRVGEIVDGISSVHVNDMSNYERADISHRLGRIFKIRYEIFQRKFFVKFLNNFLAQLTPFLFYMIGGYFALTGRLDIGQLVAVIAAYKDLPSPIKELIDWDQQRLDIQVKYTQVYEQFSIDNMLPREVQPLVKGHIDPLDGGYQLTNLSATDESGATLFERVNLAVNRNEKIALVGALNSGVEYLAETLSRLLVPSSGKIALSDRELSEYTEAVTGRRIGYAAHDLTLMHGSLRDNLLYSVKFAPQDEAGGKAAEDPEKEWEVQEAKRTGNSIEDINRDWVDYQAVGATGPDDLLASLKATLALTDLEADVLNLGLRGLVDVARHGHFVEQILSARKRLHIMLQDEDYAGLVEQFDPERYSNQATIGENLLFGTPVTDDFTFEALAGNTHIRSILAKDGLDSDLFEMGREIAETAIELFADLPPDHPFFEQLSFMTADQIPEYQAVLSRINNETFATAGADDRRMIMRLPYLYIEPRHRLGLLDDDFRRRIVAARKAFRETLPERLKDSIEFYDPDTYNQAASVQDNILAGRIAYGVAGGPERIMALVRDVLEENSLHDAVLDVGLDFNVGTGGKRLSTAQRQKVLLARALIKRPDILIVNRALSALDKQSQSQIISKVVEALSKRHAGVVWVLANADLAMVFDRVVVMSHGQIVEQGGPKDLLAKAGEFAKLAG
jgi:putative ABC transport system ATP-binding protein